MLHRATHSVSIRLYTSFCVLGCLRLFQCTIPPRFPRLMPPPLRLGYAHKTDLWGSDLYDAWRLGRSRDVAARGY
ncbi:hypothetical protein F4819DRAFT_136233 [Hypoxylon fuscum]|nr:hypothetical protein F4819DRAFT_136233 [Hypoxylon fuscum]